MSNLRDNELKIKEMQQELSSLNPECDEYKALAAKLYEFKKETYKDLSHWDKVCIARSPERLKAKVLIDKLITDFFEIHGDQLFSDDQSIIAGIGFLDEIPVTVLAQAKGTNTEESIRRNFGMTSPEGFRKTLRLAKEAEKFYRPIITIVDTSGAYPGKGAEERGQARAIAQNIMEFSKLRVPVVAIVLSEGGSGGALALTVSDYVFMFENATYSVLSPEGFSSILFKNSKTAEEAANIMKLTSHDLKEIGVVDEILYEPLGGIKVPNDDYVEQLRHKISKRIKKLQKTSLEELLEDRYNKFRKIGL